eukprot:3668640-Amphidinium_carterae.1
MGFNNVFERQAFDVPLSQCDLAVVLKWNNKMLAAKIRSSGDPALDCDLWAKVEDEIDRGWLVGPCGTLGDLERVVGPECVVSRRFAIKQGAKTRPIDDLSESQVNRGFALAEKVDLMGVDVMAAAVRLDAWRHGSLMLSFDPVRKGCRFFAQVTVPSGGNSSVLGFNR